MSLVRIDREIWMEKKFIKWLKIFRSKLRRNYNELFRVIDILKFYNLDIFDLYFLCEKWIYNVVFLDNIIFRREEKV